MKRAQRLNHFRSDLENTEKEQRAKFTAAQARVDDALARLTELKRYRDEYLQGFGRRAAGGMDAIALRDYHAFVARLGEAIQQQQQIVLRTEHEREFERQRWNEAATRCKAVGSVVERWQAEDDLGLSRAEQRETDEWARLATSRAQIEG
ncbi:MAG: flagellar export protein FliJ [Steroidobacteraceae bacterium]|nr:flagellar export protein FliJ [Nevskiaceae bacterium]MCP5339087.1 flagellar export protein FliJ [Nevskiaceae bacterium]MCP5359996.1 flagellar export protein FliJ [Nevskiaceae bacterium]MCP5466926.1 flagellar export protein FliJ [Nevskiaceae bacterium]MCP5472184.1 flagellar export protein FliJ [Nevskiaceae bacterium]